MNNLLNKNLDNTEYKIDLFGNKIEKLSMKDRIGFLPISVWRPKWSVVKDLKNIIGDKGQTRNLKNNNITGLPGFNNSASVFNPHLAQMVLSAYCPSNANIYDAFGGGGTRGFIATAMKHNYTGIEIRQNEVDRIKRQQQKLGLKFNITCDDSRIYDIDEDSFDFSYTCPPYYNLEIYSDMDGDMSSADTYEEFLEMIKGSIEITYKGLRENSLSVWIVGNFRNKKGELVHFSGDLIRIAKEVGFKLHDELIFWGASGVASMRCGQFGANRKSVRVHEYIIIFKK